MSGIIRSKPVLSMLIVYSVAHFLVDFGCAFLMFREIHNSTDWYFSILIYNFCAFALQMPIGVLADKMNRNAAFAAAGCILVAAAYGAAVFPIVAAVIGGIGNALFHIGGGVDVLNISMGKSGPLGVFVSPGAFGIFLGTMLGKSEELPAYATVILLLIAAGLILLTRHAAGAAFPRNADFSIPSGLQNGIITAVVCFSLVVCLRSYVGAALSFPWKGAGHWAAILLCAVVIGKATGGFLADRVGAIPASFLSLGLASILFPFSGFPAAGVIAVLLFNMTMPITLWAVIKIFPGAKGFSFGLLTFGLFLGFLPSYLGATTSTYVGWPFALASAASLLLLWAGLRRVRP